MIKKDSALRIIAAIRVGHWRKTAKKARKLVLPHRLDLTRVDTEGLDLPSQTLARI